MTEKEARAMTPEDAAKLPWDSPVMMFLPGRYYLCMANLRVPCCGAFPNGGDVTGLFWRYDTEPKTWRVNFRYRYYAKKDGNPWDGEDHKSWWSFLLKDSDEAGAEEAVDKFLTGIATVALLAEGVSCAPVDIISFRCDARTAMDILQREKRHWMHVRVESSSPEPETKNKK